MTFQPTLEQQNIVSKAIQGKNLAVLAFAGAAKTTTCTLIAQQLQKKSLYIAFNKSIAEEAKGKFPAHVECRTLHSLAYAAIIAPQKMYKKVGGYFDTKQFLELFGDQLDYLPDYKRIESVLKVTEILRGFCQSDALNLDGYVLSHLEGENDSYQFHLPLVTQAWAAVTSKASNVQMTHDVYLKMFQLSNPNLEEYEVIYLDEAQDSNPVTLDIFYRQTNSQLIMVGDTYQSIYEFRGAINAFDTVTASNFNMMYLTESFRFTPSIATIANTLTSIAGNTKQIIGRAEPKVPKTKAILCRTNASILNYLLTASQQGYKVHVIADLTDLWSKMYHLAALSTGSKPKYPNSELRRFSNYGEFQTEAENNPDLKRLLNISFLLSQGKGTHGNIVAIKEAIVEDASKAAFSLVTAHKSKGLEWDEVELDEDMLRWDDEEGDLDELLKELKSNQTLNLLYVAVTRAKYVVRLPSKVLDVLDHSNYLKSEWELALEEVVA